MAGSNCIILHYTGKECDVSPYRDDYDPIQNVPIVTAATAWQSPATGKIYILVLNEVLWMGDTMQHTLLNPNQLRHFGTIVQDNPMSDHPLSIITEDYDFSMGLTMAGTIVYTDTHTPSENELTSCPHVQLTSPKPWDPHTVRFPKPNLSLEDVIVNNRQVSELHSSVNSTLPQDDSSNDTDGHSIFDLHTIQRRISSMSTVFEKILTRDDKVIPGQTDAPLPPTFQSSERHSDVSPKSLSEKWCISLETARKTLCKTTQSFQRSAVLPLGRRYRADRMFTRKTLAGNWSTDTVDGRCKSLDGNKYCQVFANTAYFSRIYPMDSKRKAGDALKFFCQEFGIPEKLTFDGSKEQIMTNTEFMKQLRSH